MPAKPITLGRVAFEAYAEVVGVGFLPRWESLDERFQSAWANAASRAVERWIQAADYEDDHDDLCRAGAHKEECEYLRP